MDEILIFNNNYIPFTYPFSFIGVNTAGTRPSNHNFFCKGRKKKVLSYLLRLFMTFTVLFNKTGVELERTLK